MFVWVWVHVADMQVHNGMARMFLQGWLSSISYKGLADAS